MTSLRQHREAIFLAVASILGQLPVVGAPQSSYDSARTTGIEHFGGSAAAKHLLARNGFVVADPYFKQIFQPYIESPLPVFITTDSAWHTYHVLLEEGVEELEEAQSRRLATFSRLLWTTAKQQAASGKQEYVQLAGFASVGLALQEKNHRDSLAPAEKDFVEELRSGATSVEAPIGFSLSPTQFRAQSFYTRSAELTDYFAARQWYASVVFRLSNPQETRLALLLARLVDSHADLLALWKQLSDPYDSFLAPAEDGSIAEYAAAIRKVLGDNVAPAILAGRLTEIQRDLEARLPAPRVNDSLLSPEQYADFGRVTKGFRLLPPRRLPCAVCFQNTVDPKIPKRMFPSGLDFLVASPTLRSPAAVRALELQLGKQIAEAVAKVDCGPLPNSLHGEAMQLLAKLQEPLPTHAPPALRTEAWADQQLWTQLGAWAEQRHTWALHSKITVSYAGMAETSTGMVAPYPEFFSGLARLARRTAEGFKNAGSGFAGEIEKPISDVRSIQGENRPSKRHQGRQPWWGEFVRNTEY